MRKAQVKMTENIMIIFIFLILLVLGMIFYARIHRAGVEREAEKLAAEEAVEIALRVSYLPEVICSESIDIKADCFDIIKLEIAKGEIEKDIGYYYDLLRYSEVKVEKIFPLPKETWVLYDNKGNLSEKLPPAFIPINLHDPVSDKYSFGVLEVAKWV